MQKQIAVRNITYSINTRPILSGVSFRCDDDERLCIFGENGAGKSTLLKILAGQLEADGGVIEKQGHVRFVYVAQEFDQTCNDMTIAEYVEKHAGKSLYGKVFALSKRLGFGLEGRESVLCGGLSGGQQKIVVMSCAFAQNPDFILLDEPENHLDIVSRVELTHLMEEFRGGIIFISHDRHLIDAVATKIGEIAGGQIQLSEGGYDDYIEMKMQRLGGLQRAYDAETKRIKQLAQTIVILRQKAHRGKEIAAYRKALEEFNALKKAHKEEGRPDDEKTRVSIAHNRRGLHSGKLLCKVQKGSFWYDGGKPLFKDVTLEIRSGEKVVVLGRNGSGKSTFLKCLTGALPLTEGEVVWGEGIRRAYFDQHAEFDPDMTAQEVVMKKTHCSLSEAQAALGTMKFDTQRMATPTKDLSGGERMRIRFAIVFGQKPDFILLDEPTNHIDEITWEILLEACQKTKSSLLLVTHDYEFIQEMNIPVFWTLTKGTIESRHKDLDTLLEEMKG